MFAYRRGAKARNELALFLLAPNRFGDQVGLPGSVRCLRCCQLRVVRGPNDSRDPDVLVAFGRPNTARSSWHNDREEGVSPAVVFEMKSRSNTRAQIAAKRGWYDKNGVAEYYEYDPELGTFRAWVRSETGAWRQS